MQGVCSEPRASALFRSDYTEGAIVVINMDAAGLQCDVWGQCLATVKAAPILCRQKHHRVFSHVVHAGNSPPAYYTHTQHTMTDYNSENKRERTLRMS